MSVILLTVWVPEDLAHSIRKLSKGAEISGPFRERTPTINARNKTANLNFIISANMFEEKQINVGITELLLSVFEIFADHLIESSYLIM